VEFIALMKQISNIFGKKDCGGVVFCFK